ncbi:hypothetical protein [Polyangium jinanense]|uniref:Uncharacterized protein n=1 Tax=Polyangium jinanense TaxID=2829994 RepID=A0A9X3X2M0_9BACT|nr:hypothetical protein [Polyangium jinanense]MDC3955153.1 hypothetical protein [Polyangium jinanense]MDC3981078.1 hypothetical protein [Polyangium jinanense]
MSTKPLRDGLITLLAEQNVTFKMIAAAAELIAADATFNLWFARVAKVQKGMSQESVLTLLDEYERICQACVKACERTTTLGAAEREAPLVHTFRQGLEELRGLMGHIDISAIP